MPSPQNEPNIHPKLIIQAVPNSEELIWICKSCKNSNLMDKSMVSMNHSYSCWSCGYTFAVGYVPDQVRYFLKSTNPPAIDVRPRIVINRRIH